MNPHFFLHTDNTGHSEVIGPFATMFVSALDANVRENGGTLSEVFHIFHVAD
jgi:hypothetical protein